MTGHRKEKSVARRREAMSNTNDQGLGRPEDRPRPSPRTDPTNPAAQETVGQLAPNERSNERRTDEEGLTEEDRIRRDPSVGSGPGGAGSAG